MPATWRAMASRMDPDRARYRRRVVAYLDEAIPEERALWEFIDSMPNGRVRQAALREMLLSGQRVMLKASTIKAMVRQARTKVAHLQPAAGITHGISTPLNVPLSSGTAAGDAVVKRARLPFPKTPLTPPSVTPPHTSLTADESQGKAPPTGARRRLMW